MHLKLVEIAEKKKLSKEQNKWKNWMTAKFGAYNF